MLEVLFMTNLSKEQQDKIMAERDLAVYKRNDMVQQSRHNLSVQEQRIVLYAISKIKPEDTYLTEYTFDIKNFYNVCGLDNDSYTATKKTIKELSDRSWWHTLPDGTETLLRWFTTARISKDSGKITIKFHEDMMPFLIQLAEQNTFYTSYNLKYVLPMNSKHSPRLYEILKSYQQNNEKWFFQIDTLKKLLNCEKYKRFPDFRRYVLDPAVEEINKYTDIKITYGLSKEGRKVTRITFAMVAKTDGEAARAQDARDEVLDGQLFFEGVLDRYQTEDNSLNEFIIEGNKALEEERKRKEESKNKIAEWITK